MGLNNRKINRKEGDMITSDKMFSDLGFEKQVFEDNVEYVRHGTFTMTSIVFWDGEFYNAKKYDVKTHEALILDIDKELHDAISKKLEELNW